MKNGLVFLRPFFGKKVLSMAMKRANGDGSVYKIGGKRRKPFGARITVGWQIDPNTGSARQIYQSIGTFASRVEAETALNNYLQNPYDIEAHKITFSGVYDLWSAEYYETLKNPSSARSYKAAYNYCSPIYDVRMRDLRVSHLQGVIKDADVGESTKLLTRTTAHYSSRKSENATKRSAFLSRIAKSSVCGRFVISV